MARDWEYKPRSCLRPRVPRVGTTSPAFTRAVNPLILDVPVSFGVFCGTQNNHKNYSTIQKLFESFFLLTTFVCGVLVKLPCGICALWTSMRICVLGPSLHFAFPLLGNSPFASPPVPPSRCTISAARTVRCLFSVSTLDHGLDGDQIHLRSGLCPVPLRPEVHLRRHHRRCRHTAGVLQFREFFAGDVGSRFAHATAFDATYQQTPELPENHPTIVGSVWEQEILFLWMAILFCTAVAVAQCLASSALFSRFKWYNLGLPRRDDFVAGYAARTSCQRFMPQAQSLAFR